ncbi:MAG: hydrolase [Nitrospirota bacterium]|jgi:nicotinamidase-related amidase
MDVQERFVPAVHGMEHVERNLRGLLRLCHGLEMPVLFTEQYPEGLGRTLHSLTTLYPSAVPFEKTHFDACLEPGFMERFRPLHRKQVLIAGIESHVCVQQTARSLRESGYDPYAIADAIASRTPENRDIGLGLMRQCGVAITSTEAVLMELLISAEDRLFKEVLDFLKE